MGSQRVGHNQSHPQLGVVFAWWYSDTFSYMNNGHLWWTMSPSRISASTVYIDVAYSMLDNVHSGYVTSSAVVSGGVRPSIALKSGTKIGGGKGTTEEPFILE